MRYVTNRPVWATALVLTAALLCGPPSHAQSAGTRLDEADAVREAMARNSSLRASLYDYQQAHQTVIAEDSTYVPRLLVDAGVTHSESPRLTGDSTATSSSDSIDLGTELQHTFPWGTAFSVRLEGNRASSTSQYAAGADQLVTTGPGYGLLGRLSVTQPLLRGFGTDVGESSWRQAELSRTSSERARDQAASQTLRDVLVAYWELWYTDQALGIEQGALELAQRRRDDAKRRVEAGADAPVAALPFETRVAELEQSVLSAVAQWQQQSLQLGLLLGRDAEQAEDLHAAADSVPSAPERERAQILKAAVEQSQVVAQQKVQLELARERALVAGESDRPRLDLEGYVQTHGLGNQAVPPALEQFATFGAVSAHVGLVFEIPLSGARHSAQRRAAEAGAEATRERLYGAEQQAKTDAAAELVKLAQARRKVELALAMADVAERNATAQQKRFDAGDAIALEVHEAEDELRRARLTVERARVDAVQASIRIDHLVGLLLRRYAAIIPDSPAKLGSSRSTAGLIRLGPF